jgi:2-keto-4-pentenoate hydratase/2-oxohepta-3-ene-1,7-dioic acid hydratase in catechol pathway
VRFANHNERLVLVTETELDLTPVSGIDVADASAGRFESDPQRAFDRWDELLTWAQDVETGSGLNWMPLTASLLGPPTPAPRQVFAIGLNYADHVTESGMEAPAENPATFTKFPASITGPYTQVHLPSTVVDWEVELVVVMGRETYKVSADRAWDYVAGLTVGQDFSERVVQLAGGMPQFSLGKSYPGFSPMGPSLVTPDDLPDRSDLRLTTTIDGETMQDGRTAQLIFDVPTLIDRLSQVLPLFPGDVIFTGTPAGVGGTRTPPRFLKVGETLVSEIEGIGRMSHTFHKHVA